jgi:hypothetical protein
MKHPLSVTIITKDRRSLQEIHHRFDTQTGFPRLALIGIFLRALFTRQL